MNYKILLGMTGSVASILYDKIIKSLETVGVVDVILTERTSPFIDVNKITNIIYTDDSEWRDLKYKKNDPVLHIDLVNQSNALIIAPASANTIAKIANGSCDNLLTSIALAWDYSKPFIVCPAMNTRMYLNPVTQRNIKTLKDLGIIVLNPQSKELACGDIGIGALCDIKKITDAVELLK